jgi:hypothetical protein
VFPADRANDESLVGVGFATPTSIKRGHMTRQLPAKSRPGTRARGLFAAMIAASSLLGFSVVTASAASHAGEHGNGNANGVVNGHGQAAPVAAPSTGTTDGTTSGVVPATSTSTTTNTATQAVPAAAPATKPAGGQHNAGDVWVDNVGQVSGPGHEMDPHLQCADINLWGNGLEDPSGTFMIDGWHPSGAGTGDFGKPGYNPNQAWPNDQAHAGTAAWNYSGTGNKIIAVVNVHQLIANAKADGDAPINKQGFHFKLQFSQDPQKHKTFWVNCVDPTPPPPVDCDGDRDGSLATDADCTTPPADCDGDHDSSQAADADCTTPPADCDGDHDSSQAADADCTTPPVDCDGDRDGSLATDADCAPAGGVQPASSPSPVNGVLGASTTTPSSGVLGASTTNPVTGHPILFPMILALALVLGGAVLLAAAQTRRKSSR